MECTTLVRAPHPLYSFSFFFFVIYYNGQGVDQDDDKALKCYIQKRDAGAVRTIKLIGVMYENGRGFKHG